MGGWTVSFRGIRPRFGIGGNLSEGYSSIDWSAAQQAGAVDGAVESAVGVLLYQMASQPSSHSASILQWLSGMAPVRVFWLAHPRSRSIRVMIVLVNWIFQRSPVRAAGVGTFNVPDGLAIGNTNSDVAACDVDRTTLRSPEYRELANNASEAGLGVMKFPVRL